VHNILQFQFRFACHFRPHRRSGSGIDCVRLLKTASCLHMSNELSGVYWCMTPLVGILLMLPASTKDSTGLPSGPVLLIWTRLDPERRSVGGWAPFTTRFQNLRVMATTAEQ
jgi:hypothetical protein